MSSKKPTTTPQEVTKDVSINDSEPESEEYEEIDLTENPLYQVLSAFFENEKGENLVDHLAKLTAAIETNTKMLETVLTNAKKTSSK